MTRDEQRAREWAQGLIEKCASQVSTSLPGELWNLEPTIAAETQALLARRALEARKSALEEAAQVVRDWKFMACSDADGLVTEIRSLAAGGERT